MQIKSTDNPRVLESDLEPTLSDTTIRNIPREEDSLDALELFCLYNENLELDFSASIKEITQLCKTLYTLLRSKDTPKDKRELCLNICEKNMDLIAMGLQDKRSHKVAARLLGLIRKSPKSHMSENLELRDKAENLLLSRLNKKPFTLVLAKALGPSNSLDLEKQLQLINKLEYVLYDYYDDDENCRGAALVLSLYARNNLRTNSRELQYAALDALTPIEYVIEGDAFFDKFVTRGKSEELFYNAEVAIALLNREQEDPNPIEAAISKNLCHEWAGWLDNAFLRYDKCFEKLTELVLKIPLTLSQYQNANPVEAQMNFEEGIRRILENPKGKDSIGRQLQAMDEEERVIVLLYFQSLFDNLGILPTELINLCANTFSVQVNNLTSRSQSGLLEVREIVESDNREEDKISALRGKVNFLIVERSASAITEFSKACLEQISVSKFGEEWAKLWVDGLNTARKSLSYRENTEVFLEPFYNIMSEYGLDGREMLSVTKSVFTPLCGAWPESSPIDNLHKVIYKSLNCIANIDSEIPLGARKLRKVSGIKVFGRYPWEMLVEQIKLLRRDSSVRRLLAKPCISVYLPISDWNGAFFGNQEVTALQNEFSRKRDRHPVVFTESSSDRGLLRQMLKAKRIFGEIEYAIVGGHGSEESFTLYKNQKVSVSDVKNPNMRSILRRIFADEAQIILSSCEGGVKDGMADTTHKHLNGKKTTIYSSSLTASVDSISFRHFRNKKPRLSAEFSTKKGGLKVNSTTTHEDSSL